MEYYSPTKIYEVYLSIILSKIYERSEYINTLLAHAYICAPARETISWQKMDSVFAGSNHGSN